MGNAYRNRLYTGTSARSSISSNRAHHVKVLDIVLPAPVGIEPTSFAAKATVLETVCLYHRPRG